MDTGDDATGPLSREEGEEFVRPLRRYLLNELDQCEFVMTEGDCGPVYAIFTNKCPEGWPEEAFRRF